jgi:hypothetical protein
MGIEYLNQLGKIRERTCQAVDLVHHHNVDLAGPHLGQERLKGWTVERGSGKPAIFVTVSHNPPALPGLAADIGFASFALGSPASEHAAIASIFAAGILARLPGPVLWCLRGRDLFAPALARVGLHPGPRHLLRDLERSRRAAGDGKRPSL